MHNSFHPSRLQPGSAGRVRGLWCHSAAAIFGAVYWNSERCFFSFLISLSSIASAQDSSRSSDSVVAAFWGLHVSAVCWLQIFRCKIVCGDALFSVMYFYMTMVCLFFLSLLFYRIAAIVTIEKALCYCQFIAIKYIQCIFLFSFQPYRFCSLEMQRLLQHPSKTRLKKKNPVLLILMIFLQNILKLSTNCHEKYFSFNRLPLVQQFVRPCSAIIAALSLPLRIRHDEVADPRLFIHTEPLSPSGPEVSACWLFPLQLIPQIFLWGFGEGTVKALAPSLFCLWVVPPNIKKRLPLNHHLWPSRNVWQHLYLQPLCLRLYFLIPLPFQGFQPLDSWCVASSQ